MLKYLGALLLSFEMATCCPDLWIQLNDNCYKVSPNPMNWYSAQEVMDLTADQTFCVEYKTFHFSIVLLKVDTKLKSTMKMNRC